MTARTSLHDDSGVGLVELVVGMVVALLFASMLAMILINGWNAQEKAVARDNATGQANVLRATMAESIRNATAVRVSNSGTRVDAVVAKPSASFSGAWDWECRAWVFTAQSIRYSAGTTQRAADASSWTVLVGKSAQRPLDTVTAPSGVVPFTLLGSRGVQVALDVTVGAEQKTVRISDGITSQAVAQTGAITCW